MADAALGSPKPQTTPSSNTTNIPKQVNLKALSYLLNETVAHAVKTTIKNKSKDNKYPENIPGRVDYLKNVSDVVSPSTLSYMNKIGYNVGFKIAQILLIENSEVTSIGNISTSLLVDNPLEAMKFICRDVWKNLFGKQMDNLRTNHIGTFVLVDNKPVPFASCHYYSKNDLSDVLTDNNSNSSTPRTMVSSTFGSSSLTNNEMSGIDEQSQDDPTVSRSKAYIEFTCGVIQGVLYCLGVGVGVASVIAKVQSEEDTQGDEARSVTYTVETRSS